jgi:hypothetical protein
VTHLGQDENTFTLPTETGFVFGENGEVVLEEATGVIDRITIVDGKLYIVWTPTAARRLAKVLKLAADAIDPDGIDESSSKGAAAAESRPHLDDAYHEDDEDDDDDRSSD